MIKSIFSSFKYEIKAFKSFISDYCSRLCFWRWDSFSFPMGEQNATSIHFTGRADLLPILKSLLGISSETNEPKLKELTTHNEISVYELPMPNTLCIPHCLSTIVSLDRSIEDIMAGYSRSLRRSILKLAPKFKYEMVTNESMIQEIDATMLRPYAINRIGITANQVPLSVVKDLALNEYGRLDLLYEGDVPVGCHLGNAYTRKGKRYWHVNRFGYIDPVFSDYSRLQETNAANLHLALLYAIDQRYDFCDYGPSLAKPGAGLIEWKRRRKGFLVKAGPSSFYIKVPNHVSAQFFWDSPMFSLNGENINLHLGVPENKTEEELIAKYREMGYDGLSKVYLMCATKPSDTFVELITGLYAELRFKPQIVISITA